MVCITLRKRGGRDETLVSALFPRHLIWFPFLAFSCATALLLPTRMVSGEPFGMAFEARGGRCWTRNSLTFCVVWLWFGFDCFPWAVFYVYMTGGDGIGASIVCGLQIKLFV